MLTTDRLILRAPRTDDLDDMFDFMSDPRAMAYWSTPPHPDTFVTAEQLGRMINAPDPRTYFAFEHNGQMIGMGGLHAGHEVGFMLHPDHWRKGLVSEAMNAIHPHIWQVTDLDHVFADADPRNAASVGLLESLGYIKTGTAERTYCIEGVWTDSVYYRLNRPSQ